MIGKFWDELFRYADKLKKRKEYDKLDAVHHVEDLLQKAYDNGMSDSREVMGYVGKTDLEKLILLIPDIKVYIDPWDDNIWYELGFEYNGGYDKRRFDTPEEVVKHLIRYREKQIQIKARSYGYEHKRNGL